MYENLAVFSLLSSQENSKAGIFLTRKARALGEKMRIKGRVGAFAGLSSKSWYSYKTSSPSGSQAGEERETLLKYENA